MCSEVEKKYQQLNEEKKKLQHFSCAWKCLLTLRCSLIRGWEREPSGMWKLEVVLRLSYSVSFFFFLVIFYPVQNVYKCNMAGIWNIWSNENCETKERKEQEKKKSSECCGIFYGPLINSWWRVQGECYNNLLCQPSARRLTVGKSLCDSSSPHSLFKADLHASHSIAGQPQNGRNTAS